MLVKALSQPYDTVIAKLMMRPLFRQLGAVLCLLFAVGILGAQTTTSFPQPTGYVDDYASVLTPAVRTELEALCADLHNRTRAQLFLVTVHTLNGESIAEYANDLFQVWKIGEKKTDRGVLILIATDDRKYRVEVGYGVEGVLPDAEAGDIGRAMVPYLKQSDYDGAARSSVTAIAQVIAQDAHVTLATPQPAAAALSAALKEPSATSTGDFANIVFAVAFFGLILFLLIRAVMRQNRGSGGKSYTGSDASYDSNSSSSSSDSSSSAESFSGGDGGMSGGGGADGGW